MPGTGPAPTVSHFPPQAERYQPREPSPHDDRKSAAPERGRVISVFGPPGAGTSTIIDCLVDACETRTAVLKPDFGSLEEQIRAVRAEVVFVDGYPPCASDSKGYVAGPDAIQYLYDKRLIFPGSGAIVRVLTDPEYIMHQRRASQGGISTWFAGLSQVEDHIRLLGLPYFVIHNEPGASGLESAVGDLARRASISR